MAAPQLAFTSLDGQPRSFATLRGAPVVVVVWKASCAPCLAELRHLDQVAARAPKWRFVTLALDDRRTAVQMLPRNARVADAWVARDEATVVLKALNPAQPALPLTVALDRSGRICARRVGLLGSDLLRAWSTKCSK